MGMRHFTKEQFVDDGKGNGLKWEEEPGVYLNKLVHKGDNRNDGEEYEKKYK